MSALGYSASVVACLPAVLATGGLDRHPKIKFIPLVG
jgi:hypothetical protein